MGDTYLHVTIQLVRGKHRVFYDAMADMIPALEEAGWRFVCGMTPALGRLGAVYHVWSVPSADGYVTALDKVRSHPRAMEWHDAYAESVLDEVVELVRPTPYSSAP